MFFVTFFLPLFLDKFRGLLLFLHAAPDLLQLWRIFWQGYPQTSSPASATYGNPTGLQVRCANLINLNDINLINLIILLIFIPILFESSKNNSRMLLRFGEDHRVKLGHFVLPRPYEWGSPRPKQGPARASTNSGRSLWRNRVPWSRKMAIGVLWIQICQLSGLSHWKSHWKGHGRSQKIFPIIKIE